MIKICLFTYFILSITSFSLTIVKVVKNESIKDRRGDYYLELLELALEKTKHSYGDYEIDALALDIVQSRTLREIQRGEYINLTWLMTTAEREQNLYPIRIPLIKGFLGYRVLLIDKENEDKFKEVKTLDDLKKFTSAQGHDWPDIEILKSSGLKVESVPLYENLFRMLIGERFDYFPRGITEVWEELKNFGENKLVVEKNLLIRYPAPVYFFVRPKDKVLGQRIEEGLSIALADGSFNKLFYNHPHIKEMFKLTNISNRKIFEIPNPLLTEETKEVLKQKKYWYVQGEEKKYIE